MVMEIGYATAGFGGESRRIGIADVIRSYGIDSVRGRIAELRSAGMNYAATAIERELEAGQWAGTAIPVRVCQMK
ncbi:hypothetical protein [Nocardia sp. NPDC056100]|uniref:hypothetical protein n=1 Tax=Nocardia sp. NPDC056100 TaxID=3345712 RepID=UPI0035D5A088